MTVRSHDKRRPEGESTNAEADRPDVSAVPATGGDGRTHVELARDIVTARRIAAGWKDAAMTKGFAER